MTSALSVALALVLDYLFGELRRFHPLVGFGRLTGSLERRFYADSKQRGVWLLLLAVAPFTGLLWIFDYRFDHGLIGALVLYFALGWQSLLVHAGRVQDALLADDIDRARVSLSYMVSRDTAQLEEREIAKGAVESVLENGNDAIFAALFWFMLAGPAGVLGYRLINTLDAMWGYRSARYRHFGWAAARLDDLINLIPARLTALSYALAGDFNVSLRSWKKQGARWKSPNAGLVMAAGAGSLGVEVGGPAVYSGHLQTRCVLGEGSEPDAASIGAASSLVQRALIIWLAAIVLLNGLVQQG